MIINTPEDLSFSGGYFSFLKKRKKARTPLCVVVSYCSTDIAESVESPVSTFILSRTVFEISEIVFINLSIHRIR